MRREKKLVLSVHFLVQPSFQAKYHHALEVRDRKAPDIWKENQKIANAFLEAHGNVAKKIEGAQSLLQSIFDDMLNQDMAGSKQLPFDQATLLTLLANAYENSTFQVCCF